MQFKGRLLLLLTCSIILLYTFTFGNPSSIKEPYGTITKPNIAQDDNIPKVSAENKKDIAEINAIKGNTKRRKEFLVNKTSGDVEKLPWEHDVNFINAQDKYNTHILMNAYCAVLNDPLPGEEENVRIGTKLLCGTVIGAEKVFSQNNTIGPYTKVRGYSKGPTYNGTHLTTTIGGGVCKIASTLYNVSVKSNMQIVERHAHCMPVSYVPYGQDATVYYGNLDFKFRNTTNSYILIWAQAIDRALYIGFYGNSVPPRVEWHHEVLSTKKTTKVYNINKKLKKGHVKSMVEGMDGAVVKSWITINYADKVIRKQLGKSVYLPLPYIYEKGL